MARLQQIRARLTVLEEGYAVHVKCGSQAELVDLAQLTTPGQGYRCCNCGPVSIQDVVHPATVQEFAAADIRYLLDCIDRAAKELRGGTTDG
jgi:hypothetical protein